MFARIMFVLCIAVAAFALPIGASAAKKSACTTNGNDFLAAKGALHAEDHTAQIDICVPATLADVDNARVSIRVKGKVFSSTDINLWGRSLWGQPDGSQWRPYGSSFAYDHSGEFRINIVVYYISESDTLRVEVLYWDRYLREYVYLYRGEGRFTGSLDYDDPRDPND